ncbi:MAG TPA: DUF4157 domain-containing protein [Allosphingosinicella sp.]|jgi:hypothetical protein
MHSFVPPRTGSSDRKLAPRPRQPVAAPRPARAPGQFAGGAAARREAPAPAEPSLAVADGLPEGLQIAMEAMSGFSLADVVVHRNSAEPARLGAAAFTKGSEIHLAPGQERHLPHEAWHVVQQAQGRVKPTLQMKGGGINEDAALEAEATAMGARARASSAESDPAPAIRRSLSAANAGIQLRRLPVGAGLQGALPAAPAAGDPAIAGMARLLSRAWDELTFVQQNTVKVSTLFAVPDFTDAADLLVKMQAATRSQVVTLANAIRDVSPGSVLGDPALIDTGARPLPAADVANLATLVANADAVFAAIAGGGRDADLAQVFGLAEVGAAKTKYANARIRMNALTVANKIVTDRSGYSEEARLGGLSSNDQIALLAAMIDQPNDHESVVTMIHESMHAGNGDVHDKGYIGTASFTALPAAVKLTNAAHFEVVPRRIRGANHAYAAITFIPAGAVVGGVAAPALTPAEVSVRNVSETFRMAWTAGLNLHKLYVRLFRAPAEWNALDLSTAYGGVAAGLHFSDALPYWSKVEMLTIHDRAAINPAGAAAAHPVTLIDIALSEGLIRKLSSGMAATPATPAAAQTLLTATHATMAQLQTVAGGGAAAEAVLLSKVISTYLGSITGDVARDERVVARLAQAGALGTFVALLTARAPATFP